jgi:hypothetical protein
VSAKDKVLITVETFGSGVKLTIDTEKRGEMVRNLEVETKELIIVDKRAGERLALVGSTDLQ